MGPSELNASVARRWGRLLCCLGWVVLYGGLGGALASHYTGSYAAEGATLRVQHDERGNLTGELMLGGERYLLTGQAFGDTPGGGQLAGPSEVLGFQTMLAPDGRHLYLLIFGFDASGEPDWKTARELELARMAAEPSPPHLPHGVQAVRSDRGWALVAQGVQAGSASEALRRVMGGLVGFFEPYPEFLGGVQAVEGNVVQAPFRAVHGGLVVYGLAIARSDGMGRGSVGLAFDVAARAPQTLDGLVQALEPHVPPLSIPRASAQPSGWHTVSYGTGQLRLPEGWLVTGAHEGAVDVVGPAGEALALGIGLPISAVPPLFPTPGFIHSPPLPPLEAVRQVTPQLFALMNRRYEVTRIVEHVAIPSELGGEGAFILWDAVVDGRPYRTLALVMTAPISFDRWFYYTSSVAAPSEHFAAALPLMLEVWGSWEIDPRVFQERLQRAQSAMQEVNRILSDSHARSQQAAANTMYNWSEVFRGDAIVRDTRTGEEGTTAIGWVNETLEALNRAAGYERFEYVPLRAWWQGQ